MGDLIKGNFPRQQPEAPSARSSAPNYRLRRFLTLGLPSILAISTGVAISTLSTIDRDAAANPRVKAGCDLVVEQGQTAWHFASQIGSVIGGDPRNIEAQLPAVIGNPANIANIQAGSILYFPVGEDCSALIHSGDQLLKQ